ncbi:MAG: glycosyltransferase family 4 protein [Anaerolineales bacterium]
MKSTLKRVCLTPRVSGVGGMVSFQAKLTTGLEACGIQVTYDLEDEPFDSVLVIGGTRQLVGLRRAKRRGIPIVQRLDGMNWLHRRTRTGLRHWLRAEVANWLLAYIRGRIATRMVYQSRFVQDWWRRVYGEGPSRQHVIHNGVNLDLFNPQGEERPPQDRTRILLVEGSLQGGYELGLQSAVALAEAVQTRMGTPVALVVAGRVETKLKEKWNGQTRVPIEWLGVLPNEEIPALNRGAHLLYSSDLNAACPNSVIEALACGLPVLAFDTGALKELVIPQSGRVAPYGGDPWKLDEPNIEALSAGAFEIMANQAGLRAGARARAEEAFGLDKMVNAYIEALRA